MATYSYVDVSEQQLEDLVRQYTDKLEEGLRYVAHQRQTDSGRLDALLVDSGHSLVLAELKVTEDDGMLLQAVDYYDHLSSHLESVARLYADAGVDPTQALRLFLIAPSFSQALVTRCKWLDLPVSLFSYRCISLSASGDIIPVFTEVSIPSPLEPLEQVYSIEDRLGYVTDGEARALAERFLDELRSWDRERVLVEPIKYHVSVKVSGRVFAYLSPRRKFFIVETHNDENAWSPYPVKSRDDLQEVIELVRRNFDRKRK